MKTRKRALALIMATVTVLTLCVGSLAYFTDRVQANTSATAGSLDLVLTDKTNAKDKITVAGNTTKFKPGDGLTIDFTLSNAGNKSADILETIVFTVTDANGNPKALTASAPEFQLYTASDVTVAANGIATIAKNATPLSVLSTSKPNQIRYAVPEYILNGTGTGAEVETGSTVKGTSNTSAYVLVFMNSATNSFQSLTLTMDYEAQAKQHRNTNSSAWTTVKSETITFAGDTAYKAVPEKTVNP